MLKDDVIFQGRLFPHGTQKSIKKKSFKMNNFQNVKMT